MPKNPRSYEKTRHIALSGLLFALAMALSFIEGSLVIPGLLPGMKLGLANIVVMYALFFMGVKQALVLDVLKALFVFLVSGFTAGFLSLCGGLLSLLVMAVLYYVVPVRPTWFILSVCGALAHNVGQLLGAGVIISSSLSLYYAPVMLVLGTLTGIQNSKFHRSCLHSAVNSSISSRTVYIRSSRPTLAPQKNSPSSTLPFTASMRAWVMQ